MGVENLPIFFLSMIGIGMMVVVIGIVKIAALNGEEPKQVYLDSKEENRNLEELFSYFLQEEEKKNQNFREEILKTSQILKKKEEKMVHQHLLKNRKKEDEKNKEAQLFDEIIKRYHQGESIEEIAKNLKKGTGEVKLIISLYSMK